jgi:hypothetical protein
MKTIDPSLLETVSGGAFGERHPPPLDFGRCRRLLAKPLGEVSRRELAFGMAHCNVPQPSKKMISQEALKPVAK